MTIRQDDSWTTPWPTTTLPRLPIGTLARPRLHARLQELFPVTVLRTMQGLGKTSLVAEWLDKLDPAEFVPIWISLTADLGTREQFAAHLARRMAATGLGAGEPVGNQPVPPLVQLDEYLSSLSEERRVVMVIDNASHLTDEALALDLITLVQRHRNMHLVVCSRAPNLIESVAIGTVAVSTLRSEDLQLALNEVRQLADAMGVDVDAAQAEQMRAEVGGWIAPLRLMLEAARNGLPWQPVAEEYVRSITTWSHNGNGAVLSLAPYSLAERLDVGLVREVAGSAVPDATDPVRTIEQSGMLDRRHVEGREVFVLPTIVQRVFRDEMKRHPDAARDFHRQAAEWFSDDSRGADGALAFHHAVAAKEFELAHRLWAENALAVAATRPGLVVRALEDVPSDILQRYPALAITRTVGPVFTTVTDVDELMAARDALGREAARAVAAGSDDLALPDLLYVATGHLVGLRLAGRLSGAERYGDEIAERAERLRTTATPPRVFSSWFDQERGVTSTLQSNHLVAIEHYRRAWAHARRSHSVPIAASAAANLAMTYALLGKTAAAERWVRRHRDIAGDDPRGGHPTGIGVHIAAALHALDRLDRTAAKVTIDLIGDGSESLELWPFIVHVNAQYGLIFGDPRESLVALNRAVQAHPLARGNARSATDLVTRARVDLLIASGNAQQARSILSDLDDNDPTFGIPLARLRLLSGEPGLARGQVERLLLHTSLTPRDRLDLLIVEAAAAARMGNHDDAEAQIRSARTFADETGIHSAFAALTAMDRELLAGPHSAERPCHSPRPSYPDQATLINLTPREQSLLGALATTSSRNEIAQQLFVSVNTVKTQLATLYSKLGATTRVDAIQRAQQLGLLA